MLRKGKVCTLLNSEHLCWHVARTHQLKMMYPSLQHLMPSVVLSEDEEGGRDGNGLDCMTREMTQGCPRVVLTLHAWWQVGKSYLTYLHLHFSFFNNSLQHAFLCCSSGDTSSWQEVRAILSVQKTFPPPRIWAGWVTPLLCRLSYSFYLT